MGENRKDLVLTTVHPNQVHLIGNKAFVLTLK